VVQVKLWHRDHRVPAIEGLTKDGPGAGVVGGGHVECGVEKRLDVDHVNRHGVRPLEDLGSDVYKECIRHPAAQDHDLGWRVVGQEECHGRTGSDRFVSNIVGAEAELFFATEGRADGSHEETNKGARDEQGFQLVVPCADRGVLVKIGDGPDQSLYDSRPADGGTEERIARPTLGAGVELLSVFLVGKDQSNEIGLFLKFWVPVGQDSPGPVSKNDVSDDSYFCPA
jgi:hypothetical protein